MTRPGSRRLTAGIAACLSLIAVTVVAADVAHPLSHTIAVSDTSLKGAGAQGPAGSPPPGHVCSNRKLLDGPKTAPAHAVRVPAGDNSHVFDFQLPPNKTYYFAPGTHTLGSGEFSQIDPSKGDRFVGAPGAIISGQMKNNFAFQPTARNVRIEHLTIEHFRTPGNQGTLTTSTGWTVMYNTISNNVPGTGIYAGSNNAIKYNCLTRNGQQGFAAYSITDMSPLTRGVRDVVLAHNEISFNNTCNWEKFSHFPGKPPKGCSGAGEASGCGCSGGGKFWATDDGTFADNYVHNNYSVGMWADTNNTGFDIEGNYFADNLADALIYEISYNAVIRHNTFIHNAVGTGPYDPGFPDGAVYISESGGDSRVPGRYSGKFQISANLFVNNWAGVVLWENANRYCTSSANTSTGDCTLVDKKVANLKTCAQAKLVARQPYFADCRWRTRNVQVTGNVFRFTPRSVGKLCTQAKSCGFNALFSIYGTYKPYTAWKVPIAIADAQRDRFSHNTYYGPWHFLVFSQGIVVGWDRWTHGFIVGDSANKHVPGEEVNSVIHPSG
jgi:hypothetical protein